MDDVLEAWKEPYNPESVRDLRPKKNKPVARHATVKLHAFMPLASAIVSPDKFNKLFCKCGRLWCGRYHEPRPPFSTPGAAVDLDATAVDE